MTVSYYKVKRRKRKVLFLKIQGACHLFPLKKIRFIDETGIHIPVKDAFHPFDDDHHVTPDGKKTQDCNHVTQDGHCPFKKIIF